MRKRPEQPLVYQRLSDPILVKRAKDGDRRALGALCERHAAKVERLALHLLEDPEDARDASQEALAKLSFWLSEAATVTADLDGQRVVKAAKAGVFRLAHVGQVQALTATAEDGAGNVSTPVRAP